MSRGFRGLQSDQLRWSMKGRFTFPLALLTLLGGSFLAVRYAERQYPEHLPWTALDLDHSIGTFTGRKLSALAGEPLQCHQLLKDVHSDFRIVPSRADGPNWV